MTELKLSNSIKLLFVALAIAVIVSCFLLYQSPAMAYLLSEFNIC